MLDFSFGELLLLAVVALLVLGPERLPKAARLAGLWARKARTQWNAVKAELENEIADEELRRSLREASDAMREGAQQMHALPEALQHDPLPVDPAPAVAIDPAGHAASQVEPARAADARDSDPIEPDHDPAQLDLLGPDPAIGQMTALRTSSRPRSEQ